MVDIQATLRLTDLPPVELYWCLVTLWLHVHDHLLRTFNIVDCYLIVDFVSWRWILILQGLFNFQQIVQWMLYFITLHIDPITVLTCFMTLLKINSCVVFFLLRKGYLLLLHRYLQICMNPNNYNFSRFAFLNSSNVVFWCGYDWCFVFYTILGTMAFHWLKQ